jgi:hypothetical protein
MVGPPRLHEELGANGVEVTIWERAQGRFSQEGGDLKTWPATTRSFRSGSGDEPEPLAAFRSAGAGQPFKRDFRFPIADCQLIELSAVCNQIRE